MPTGRPSIYKPEVATEICSRLAEGQSLLQICRDENLPNRKTIYQWLLDGKHNDFCNKYAQARILQAEYLFDEMLDIADDGTNDWTEVETKSGRIIEVPDHEYINRSRLRIDTRKWYLSKVLPKKFGDKIEAEESKELIDSELEFKGIEGNGDGKTVYRRFYNN